MAEIPDSVHLMAAEAAVKRSYNELVVVECGVGKLVPQLNVAVVEEKSNGKDLMEAEEKVAKCNHYALVMAVVEGYGSDNLVPQLNVVVVVGKSNGNDLAQEMMQ